MQHNQNPWASGTKRSHTAPDMPTSPPRPCSATGCPALVRGSTRYCAAHARAEQRRIDERRGSSTERGYDWTWRTRIRPAALAREPLCRMCNDEGRVTAACEVDHIDGNSRNNDPANLRPLCKRHHSQRTARDQAFGRKG